MMYGGSIGAKTVAYLFCFFAGALGKSSPASSCSPWATGPGAARERRDLRFWALDEFEAAGLPGIDGTSTKTLILFLVCDIALDLKLEVVSKLREKSCKEWKPGTYNVSRCPKGSPMESERVFGRGCEMLILPVLVEVVAATSIGADGSAALSWGEL